MCDPAKRALYDKWKKSGIAMSYKQWLGMKDHVQQSMHWSKPNTKVGSIFFPKCGPIKMLTRFQRKLQTEISNKSINFLM